MLSEAGLILVGVLIAVGLVVLGTLELVWPTRQRHSIRRSTAARDPWRRARSTAPREPATMPTAPVAAAAVRAPAAAGESAPITLRVVEEPPLPCVPLAVEDAPPPVADVSPLAVVDVAPAAPAPPLRPEPEVSALERCFTLFE